MAYPIRYHPLMVKMKELIVNKTYGEVFQISIFTEQFTRKPSGHWILSAEKLGGGQFFIHGCHYVDLLLDLLGKPVRGSHVGTNRGTPWMEKEGTSNVVLELKMEKQLFILEHGVQEGHVLVTASMYFVLRECSSLI